MSNPISVVAVHDFTDNAHYPLPHVIVLQGLMAYMVGVERIFDDLEPTGAKQKSEMMSVKGVVGDILKWTVRMTFHFQHKGDAALFRLSVG